MLEKHARALKDHEFTERANADNNTIPLTPEISIGDLVHLYSERDKHHPRNRYLVTGVDGLRLQIRKLVGSQLRSLSYKVKLQDIFKVPCQINSTERTRIMENDIVDYHPPSADDAVH